MPKGVPKKLTRDYWESAGFSDNQIDVLIAEYRASRYKNICPFSEEVWTNRGYSTEEAKEKVLHAKKELSKTRRETKSKWIKTLNPPRGEKNHCNVLYWMNKFNMSKDEATEIVKNNGRKQSKRAIEYWLGQGLTLEEAKEHLRKFQCRDEAFFIEKYGDVCGVDEYKKFIKRSSKNFSNTIQYWTERGFSHEDANVFISKIQRSRAIKNMASISRYLNEGFSIEEAKHKVREVLKKRFINISDEMGDENKNIISVEQSRRSRLRKNSRSSKLEKFIYDNLITISKDVSKQYRCVIESKIVFVDFIVDKSIAIEIFGDFWHANPLFYKDDEYMYRGKIASKIRSDDSKRIELLREQHEKVIVIWENEILNNIENITDFLKGLIYENTEH